MVTHFCILKHFHVLLLSLFLFMVLSICAVSVFASYGIELTYICFLERNCLRNLKEIMAARTLIGSKPFSPSPFKPKSVFLHEWWLEKPPRQCKGLAVGGIASMEREKVFLSTVIVQREEANVLETEDGIAVIFHGFINASRSSQNGFSPEVCRRFMFGFPHDWKKYSAHNLGDEDVNGITGFGDSNVYSLNKADGTTAFGDCNTCSQNRTGDVSALSVPENDFTKGQDVSLSNNGVLNNCSTPQKVCNGLGNSLGNISKQFESTDKLSVRDNDFTKGQDVSLSNNGVLNNCSTPEKVCNGLGNSLGNISKQSESTDKLSVRDNDFTKGQDVSLSNNGVLNNCSTPEKVCNGLGNSLGNIPKQSELTNNMERSTVMEHENGVSDVAAESQAQNAESGKSLMGVDDPKPSASISENCTDETPICTKKMKNDHLSSDHKEKQKNRQKMVEDIGNSGSRRITRSISKRIHTTDKNVEKDSVKKAKAASVNSPVRRSPRLHNRIQ